ncbi:glycoside hydrolase family 15 protein [Bacteriovoracaceae bacterium]|nr:glycoside hydrolase family 15 protein [Bacteriovoracaceae bacterium]
MTKHKYNFGIIGNCSYMSYIDTHANVVWQCWPSFDSSFIFGSLVSEKKGGGFSIQPVHSYKSGQAYVQNTNVLETQFETKDGKFKVVDFSPRFENFDRYHRPNQLFRKVELIEGSPLIKIKCNPVGNYGEVAAKKTHGSNSINFEGLNANVRLTTNVAKTHIIHENEFVLTEDLYLVLTYDAPLEAPLKETFESFLEKTVHYWRQWVRRSSIPSIYQEEVIRSALLLKLHQYEDTGAIIAAGTTSLPEAPGEERNWDYRYCWIRDSYFTLNALTNLGHFNEAERYSHWIQNIVQNERGGKFQPVYKIDGSSKIEESILPLEGYLGNGPVRVGNDAYRQVQNDVYGQMILSLLPLYTDLRTFENSSTPSLKLVNKILNCIEQVMDKPDAGIWEFRGKMQKHAESFLFHWAGAQAAKKIAVKYQDHDMQIKAQKLIDESTKQIELCFDSDKLAYGMSQENKSLNASEFLLITMHYLDKSQLEKAKNHIEALEKELKICDDLIYRYRDHDDFGETKSTFLICAFWYAEALAEIGEIERAKKVFDSLLTRSNHLGIYSEDICPTDGSQWGNVAQTYSHVGLINTAFKIFIRQHKPSYL